jgi:hypothetical protein
MIQVGNGRNFVHREELLQLPSLSATHPHESLSNRYSFFSTMNVVDVLARESWFPVRAQEQNVLTLSRQGFQKHVVRFRQSIQDVAQVGDIFPEVVLTNSHDGFTKFSFMFGLFRLACLNGLIVSEAQFGTIKLMHMGYGEDDVVRASSAILRSVPAIVDRVQEYRGVTLTRAEQRVFAVSSLITRFSSPDAEIKEKGDSLMIADRSFDVPRFLQPLRKEDAAPTLWNTFNVVQEKLTRGNGFETTTRVRPNGTVVHKRKVQGLKGLDADLKVNRGLWTLMDKMQQLKENKELENVARS